jgi:hypothetical protein
MKCEAISNLLTPRLDCLDWRQFSRQFFEKNKKNKNCNGPMLLLLKMNHAQRKKKKRKKKKIPVKSQTGAFEH